MDGECKPKDLFMRAIKILVCSAFIMGCAGISLYNSGAVSGQGGGSSLSAPTGIIASDNKYNNKVRVEWDAIRGATSYRIFRNTLDNAATATEVGTTPANTFLDMAAAPGQTLFYWVRAENASGVSVLSSSDSGSRANATQQGPVPPLEPPPVPPANPITASKVYLGKASQRVFEGVHRVKQRFFVFLVVFVIGQRLAFHQGDQTHQMPDHAVGDIW